MRIQDGYVVLEIAPCFHCKGTRKVNEWIKCPQCKGSGKADPSKPKGRNCQNCKAQSSYAKGQVLSIGTKECSCTDGTEMETLYDDAPKEMWQGLTFKVYRSDRPQTIGEYLLGHDCAYSCTDYGGHKRLTDDELIHDVQFREYSDQASKFADRKTGKVCDHMGIFCNDNGYSVKAVFGSGEAVQNDLAAGLDVATGMRVGSAVSGIMNGTLAVSQYRRK